MPKILIVEDDEATRRGLAVNFGDDGYDVTTQSRGETVLNTVRGESPDLIVLDIMLPEMNGFEGKPSGAVSAFSIEAKTGRLNLLNQESSRGAGPCHLPFG